MALVSVLALSVVKVFEAAAASTFTVVAGAFGAGEGAGLGAAGAVTGGGAGVAGLDPPMLSEMVCAGIGAGAAGLAPPMLREIVGAGAGASVWAGRSIGGGGGDAACCWAAGTNTLPGTNENAPGLSLLISLGGRRKRDAEFTGHQISGPYLLIPLTKAPISVLTVASSELEYILQNWDTQPQGFTL